MTKIGFLHPGAMGISLATSAQNSGHEACWISDGRSTETRQRAEEHHLSDLQTLPLLTRTCSAIVSICPPHAAEDVAKSVAAQNFDGLYVDANAISPQRAIRIQEIVEKAGAHFVDGSVIGGPAWKPNNTWLQLSGDYAQDIATLFSKGPLETNIIGKEIGKASALKMAYAAYSKGTTALLAAILATAENFDVRNELEAQWAKYEPEFVEEAHARTKRVTAKAWRFAGEMDEIAETFAEAGLPSGFHEAAGEIYHRIADFKGATETPELEKVLTELLNIERL
ncbi:MAG: NAD(P)-dependent oxidoreductase [Anaerolineae bacterium]|jgi:3-hydroxyisobutyrate dehydrogenase-like beta-hydroxyacid dehydrogenase|nr:NAD(P)-dependent oxidoreductase [Anaerolineae bacterium]